MKRWLWGVLSGVVLTFVLFGIAGYVAWHFRQRPPEVKADTTLVVELQGDIPEQPSPDIPEQILGRTQGQTILSLTQAIQNAAGDKRVTAILIKPGGLEIGWGKLEQLRAALEQFKKSGKKIYALIEVGGSREYFLSSVADKIFLSPVGFLDLKGMRAEVMFFKNTLTKLGIQADLEHIGKYKNFSDQFTDNKMSDAFREAENGLLDSVYTNFINVAAASRHRTADAMRDMIENTGPFEAGRALQQGLVDQLAYEDEILDEIKNQNGGKEVHKLSMSDYSRVETQSGGDRIGVVYAVGTITSGEDQFNPVEGGKTMGSKTMNATLDEVANDSSIKGVIVRIDSPGGDAFASDEIWRGMNTLHSKKPVVISMSDLAASGGYYMAMTGDPIVAEPGTLTGSIGIVYGKLNLKGLYDKVGITKEILTRGRFSAMDSDYSDYTPEERQRVQAMMDDFYGKFLGKVATARKMTPEAVDKIAQGRVWTGEQAKNNGLVDDLGDFSKALQMLKQKAGIRADAKVELVEFPPRKTLWEQIVSRAQESEIQLPLGIGNWAAKWKAVKRMVSSPIWARMPYAFDFH